MCPFPPSGLYQYSMQNIKRFFSSYTNSFPSNPKCFRVIMSFLRDDKPFWKRLLRIVSFSSLLLAKSQNNHSEDSDAGDSVTSHPSGVQSMGPDDVQLHVHKDHGTGGHWCAKIVFFSLMAILAGLVGLIILENRGLSDGELTWKEIAEFMGYRNFCCS